MTRLMNHFLESSAAQINNNKCQRPWYRGSFLNTTRPFQHLRSTRPSNMMPMSSRRRAVVEFPLECALFVNIKAHLSITVINRYNIKSASATMGMRRQDNGFNRISILFYDNSDTAVCSSTIEIPNGWTPKLFLGLLLQEWCLSNVISLFRVEDEACDDIFKMRYLYYNRNPTQLQKLIQTSPNHSCVTGGF
jgi:hypothetical protein